MTDTATAKIKVDTTSVDTAARNIKNKLGAIQKDVVDATAAMKKMQAGITSYVNKLDKLTTSMASNSAQLDKMIKSFSDLRKEIKSSSTAVSNYTKNVQAATTASNKATDAVKKQATATKTVKTNTLGAGTATKALSAATGALIASLAVSEVIAYADAWKKVTNIIRLGTESEEELLATRQKMLSISQETRTDLQAQTTLYNRLALVQKDLGITQTQITDVIRGVGQALGVTATTALESRGSLIQLAQAFGQGIVRAEEFNSIMEGTPRIALAAADGLGLTRASLRALVLEGKISSKALFASISSQLDILEDEFGNVDATIGQGFILIKNALTQFVGELDNATESSKKFVEVARSFAKFLGENNVALIELTTTITKLVGLFIAGSGLIAAIKLADKAVLALTTSTYTLNAAFKANLIVIGATVTAMASVAAYDWYDRTFGEGAKRVEEATRAMEDNIRTRKEFFGADLGGSAKDYTAGLEKNLVFLTKGIETLNEKILEAQKKVGSQDILAQDTLDNLIKKREEYKAGLESELNIKAIIAGIDEDNADALEEFRKQEEKRLKALAEQAKLRKEEEAWNKKMRPIFLEYEKTIKEGNRGLELKQLLDRSIAAGVLKDGPKVAAMYQLANDKILEGKQAAIESAIVKGVAAENEKTATQDAIDGLTQKLALQRAENAALKEKQAIIAETERLLKKERETDEIITEASVNGLLDVSRVKVVLDKKTTQAHQDELKAQEDATKAALEAQEDAYNDFSDTIQDNVADMIRDWDGAWDTMTDIMKDALIEMAAESLTNQIVIPIVGSIGGSLGMSWNGQSFAGMAGQGLFSNSGILGSVGGYASDFLGLSGGAFAEPAGLFAETTAQTTGLASVGLAGTAVLAGIASIAAKVLGKMFEDKHDPEIGLQSLNTSLDTYKSGHDIAGEFGYQTYHMDLQEQDKEYTEALVSFFDARFALLDETFQTAIMKSFSETDFRTSVQLSEYDNIEDALKDLSDDVFTFTRSNLLNAIFAGVSGATFSTGTSTTPTSYEIVEDVIGYTGQDMVPQYGWVTKPVYGEVTTSNLDNMFGDDFFSTIQGDDEDLFDTFTRFANTMSSFEEPIERITLMMNELSLSTEEAYLNLETISTVLDQMDAAVENVTSNSTINSLRELDATWDALDKTLEESGATTEELTRLQANWNKVLGATITGLTADNLSSLLLTEDPEESLMQGMSDSLKNVVAGFVSEDLLDTVFGDINENIGKLFSNAGDMTADEFAIAWAEAEAMLVEGFDSPEYQAALEKVKSVGKDITEEIEDFSEDLLRIKNSLYSELFSYTMPNGLYDVYKIQQDYISTIQEIFAAGGDVEALNMALQLRDLQIQSLIDQEQSLLEQAEQTEYITALINDASDNASIWGSVADSFKSMRQGLLYTSSNPADAVERLSSIESWLAQNPINAENADEVASMWETYLSTAQEAYQRPSAEYQAIHAESVAALEDLENYSRDREEEMLSIAANQEKLLDEIESNTEYLSTYGITSVTTALTSLTDWLVANSGVDNTVTPPDGGVRSIYDMTAAEQAQYDQHMLYTNAAYYDTTPPGTTVNWSGGTLTRGNDDHSAIYEIDGQSYEIDRYMPIAELVSIHPNILQNVMDTFNISYADLMKYTFSGYETGVDYVPRTGIYELHEGERVVTKADNMAGNGSENITLNINMYDTGTKSKEQLEDEMTYLIRSQGPVRRELQRLNK